MPLGASGWELAGAMAIVLLGGMVQGSIGFGMKKKSGSYIVSDQNPLTGGIWPFSNRMTYACLES